MTGAHIRDQIFELFKASLGEPEVLHMKSGETFRWTLERGEYEVSMYVTIDSPEWPDMAHVLISDSRTFQADPVVSITVYTMEEAESLLGRIIKQWRAED